jgi:RecA/RadA recombinase
MSNIKKGLNELLKAANKSAKNRACIGSTVGSNWRYVDFDDESRNRPSLPLEYLYGARGFITGRIVKLDAGKATGKSSSMFMAYGMAQMTGGCWAIHYETEDTPPPADFMAHLGCDPEEVFIEHPEELTSFLDSVEDKVKTIRESIDKDNKHPILLGLDSVSGIGVDENKVEKKGGKKKDSNNSGQVAYHSRAFSKWFREKLKILAKNDVVLLASGQLKENIGAGMFASQDEQESTLAGKTFGFHATWVVRMTHSKWRDTKTGELYGEYITCRCTKNKVNAPNRFIKIHLRTTENPIEGNTSGWDFTQATVDLLSGKFRNDPPLGDRFSVKGAYYYIDGWNNDKGLLKEDFVDKFLADEELVMEARKGMRIRGFGFPFESDFKTFDEENDDA